jgi:hypothetical protein
MRATQWMVSLFLATSLCTATAIAADATRATAQAQKTTQLETISSTAAGNADKHDDCPMHQGKKECQHKNGEPCPHHHDEEHHGKSQEKCDHKHPG